MTPRDVVLDAIAFKPPAYVPWAWEPTQVCAQRLREHLGTPDLAGFIGSHFLDLGSQLRRFAHVDGDFNRDAYGVLWDRTVDKDIGTPAEWPLRTPGSLVLIGWFLVLVFTAKRCRLAMSFAFELLKTLGELPDDFAQRLRLGAQRYVVGLQLLNQCVARIGVHAIFLASRHPNAMPELCAVDNDRTNKLLLYLKGDRRC
jgi:hypothetical protein